MNTRPVVSGMLVGSSSLHMVTVIFTAYGYRHFSMAYSCQKIYPLINSCHLPGRICITHVGWEYNRSIGRQACWSNGNTPPTIQSQRKSDAAHPIPSPLLYYKWPRQSVISYVKSKTMYPKRVWNTCVVIEMEKKIVPAFPWVE